MATKAKKAAEQIAARIPTLGFHNCPPATDPAVGGVEHTVFFTQLDKPTQNQLMAIKLEAEAAVNKALADAQTKIAGVLKSRG